MPEPLETPLVCVYEVTPGLSYTLPDFSGGAFIWRFCGHLDGWK
jgi:hypothetical protein